MARMPLVQVARYVLYQVPALGCQLPIPRVVILAPGLIPSREGADQDPLCEVEKALYPSDHFGLLFAWGLLSHEKLLCTCFEV